MTLFWRCEFLLKAVLLSYFGSFSSFPSKLRMFKELTFVEVEFFHCNFPRSTTAVPIYFVQLVGFPSSPRDLIMFRRPTVVIALFAE